MTNTIDFPAPPITELRPLNDPIFEGTIFTVASEAGAGSPPADKLPPVQIDSSGNLIPPARPGDTLDEYNVETWNDGFAGIDPEVDPLLSPAGVAPPSGQPPVLLALQSLTDVIRQGMDDATSDATPISAQEALDILAGAEAELEAVLAASPPGSRQGMEDSLAQLRTDLEALVAADDADGGKAGLLLINFLATFDALSRPVPEEPTDGGDGTVTTLALGEEDGGSTEPRDPAVDDGTMTTMALGEEDGGDRPVGGRRPGDPDEDGNLTVTTFMVGEEDGGGVTVPGRKPGDVDKDGNLTVTTFMVGEEGSSEGSLTTKIGEESREEPIRGKGDAPNPFGLTT